ncbi:tRNA (34-2'-O)-methyltransferase regulator WDR6 isoform 1-T2 [Anomaloglossus baeobatrachus]|uniref:tRNA (34-2'-O)-methyltransferase regulator WDR6 n=1 Tax=Anomaloglossus baeobatrachus TaxID=238106 RepID=UPI003F5079AC
MRLHCKTKMESQLLVAPITALEFVGHHLLAGEGPNLTIYGLRSSSLSSRRLKETVLNGYVIHGIKTFSTEDSDCAVLCVFGSKGLIVLNFSNTDQEISLSRVCEVRALHDWIWDIQWLEDASQSTTYLGIALGHNSVAYYDYRKGKILKEIHCSEKCILYSAHFVGRTWKELTLFSGTVFNQLVIWGMCDQTNEEGRVEPRRRISGHNGVIFSIFYEAQRGVLASASDDRSLRLWNVGSLTSCDPEVQCLLVLYGHQARVWSVRLLSDNIISIGEDSACIIWSYSGEIIHNFKGHRGRGIRAVAIQDQLSLVATGGADCGIRLWQIKEKSSPSCSVLNLNLNFDDSKFVGAPKAILLADINCLMIMTDYGFIYTYDFISKQWTLVLEDMNYKSYGLLEVVKLSDSTLCAIGNITGSVKIFSLTSAPTCQEFKPHEGKVHSLTWVAPSPSLGTCSLFSSGPNGIMVWLEVTCVSGEITSVTEKCRYLLPTCKQRWHTSIAFVPKEGLIVCGDRRGSLMLFEVLQSASNPPEGHEKEPSHVLFGLHGKFGVTSVEFHNGFVYSSGRDGFYRQLKVEGRQLVLLRKRKSCKGMEWIESLSFTPDGDLHILGFHSTDFVVWSSRSNEKLLCVPCGGGHRSWSYKKDGSREVFVYIKSGDVFAHHSQQVERIQNVVKEPLHGRELTSVKYVGTVSDCSQDCLDILITGSEDTTVNIWAFGPNHFYCLSTLSDHLSSVKTLALARTEHKDGVLSTLLFTAGGRAQIEVYRLFIQAKEVNGSLPCQVIHLASHRLDEHWDRIKNKHKILKMDPETRYMSITTVDQVTESMKPLSSYVYLAAACSDGSVRFFVLRENSRQMILVAESFYHQRCVLKVETFIHTFGNKSRVMLCSGATDGHIALWDVSVIISGADMMLEKGETDCPLQDLGSVCFTASVHQCGINSLCVRMIKDGQYLVASGGDDNSICVSLLILDHNEGAQLLRSVSANSAHAAHVTGLRILREDLLVSVSVDQRLTVWNIGDSDLKHVATRFCHVADVSDLDCWTRGEGHLYVLCGQGLEIVKCEH